MKATLFTSGSTDASKKISHENLMFHVDRTIGEIGLTKDDIVLDVFPANVIAHYTVTALPALIAGSHLISCNFQPYEYIRLFNEYRPSIISLIPKHIEILEKTKGWETVDMSCVRYMVTGSQLVSQSLIDSLLNKGIETVANWYGMTEMPPPVFIGYNSESFDFTTKKGYSVDFTDEGECVINGFFTGDLFDVKNKTFLRRKAEENGTTWKNNI